MNLYRTIKTEAIQTAIRNADKAEARGYWVRQGHGPQTFHVVKPSGEFYVCQPTIGTMGKCECEQWNREGYCKHLELVAREEAYLADLADRAEAHEATEGDRFFMMECQAEVLAEVAGAWY